MMEVEEEKEKTKTKTKTNLVFHDFLGISCGPHSSHPPPLPSAALTGEAEVEPPSSSLLPSSSAGHAGGTPHHLPSERQGMTNSEVFHFHGRKNAMSGPESCTTFSGRKRSNSDSAYMGLIRDGMLPVGSDSHGSSHMMKMFGKEVVGERQGRSHDDEIIFTMRPPQRPTSSMMLHPPSSGRPDSLFSIWDRSLPINPGQILHLPSRFGLNGTYLDKHSSSCASRDASSGAIMISQTAADEGSRTGNRGSRIMNVINSTSGAVERNSTVVFPSDYRSKVPQTIEPESSNVPSRHSITSTSRQMTIFYGGQAHVFDDVHPNKAEVIMGLAGSNGGSWSTTFSPKSTTVHPPVSEGKLPSGESDMRADNITVPIQGNPVHGLNQVGRVLTLYNRPNFTSGGHQSGRVDVRALNSSAAVDRQGKKDV